MRRMPLVLTALAALAVSGRAVAQLDLDLRTELRVCDDPNNLPFSRRDGSGFENRIMALIGAQLGLPVSTIWFPQTIGFIRNTIYAHRCDVVPGTVAGDEMLSTTTPYYHTGYVVATRADSPIDTGDLGDKAFAAARIGVIAATPPTDLLVRHNLLAHTTSYQLMVDTRHSVPTHDLVQDLLDHRIDAALIWGPIAGYYAHHEHMPLKLRFIVPEPGAPRLDYRIAMGVRPNEADWRRTIDAALLARRDQVRAILDDYGVPLLDEQNRPVGEAPRP